MIFYTINALTYQDRYGDREKYCYEDEHGGWGLSLLATEFVSSSSQDVAFCTAIAVGAVSTWKTVAHAWKTGIVRKVGSLATIASVVIAAFAAGWAFLAAIIT